MVGNGNSARKEFAHPTGVTTEQHYEQEQQMQINGAGSEDATGQQACTEEDAGEAMENGEEMPHNAPIELRDRPQHRQPSEDTVGNKNTCATRDRKIETQETGAWGNSQYAHQTGRGRTDGGMEESQTIKK